MTDAQRAEELKKRLAELAQAVIRLEMGLERFVNVVAMAKAALEAINEK